MKRNKKGQFIKGFKPWNKDTQGVMKPNSGSFKKGDGFIPADIRFWKYVKKTDNCWNWIGYINPFGYGRLSMKYMKPNVIMAHRFSYELHKGKVPKGLFVLHTCDNRQCVNPKHLWLGTQKDNLQDMSKKGRWGNQFKKNIC